jgi:hypothetical protein
MGKRIRMTVTDSENCIEEHYGERSCDSFRENKDNNDKRVAKTTMPESTIV